MPPPMFSPNFYQNSVVAAMPYSQHTHHHQFSTRPPFFPSRDNLDESANQHHNYHHHHHRSSQEDPNDVDFDEMFDGDDVLSDICGLSNTGSDANHHHHHPHITSPDDLMLPASGSGDLSSAISPNHPSEDILEPALVIPDVVHFQSASYIQQKLRSATASSSSSRSKTQSKSEQTSGGGAISQSCLTARLSFCISQMREIMKVRGLTSVSTTAHPLDEDHMIMLTLKSLGWSATKLQLNPPSASFSIVEEHSFWLVSPPPPPPSTGVRAPQFIIDFHFAELYVVARPTTPYEKFLSHLRKDFVGTVNEARAAIRALSAWAAQSLEQRQLAVPPWRKSNFLEDSFVRAIPNSPIESVRVEDLSDEAQEFFASELKLLVANRPALLRLVDFRAARKHSESFTSSDALDEQDVFQFEKLSISPVNTFSNGEEANPTPRNKGAFRSALSQALAKAPI